MIRFLIRPLCIYFAILQIPIIATRAFSVEYLREADGSHVVSSFVNAPQQRVWSFLTDYQEHPKWASDIVRSDVKKRAGNDVDIIQTYRGSYTFGLPILAHIRMKEKPPYGLSYKLIESAHIFKLTGSWSITKANGGVYLRHSMVVEPRIPEPLKTYYHEQQKQNLIKWMTILKNQMEK